MENEISFINQYEKGSTFVSYYTDEPFYYVNMSFLLTDPWVKLSRN